MTALRHKERWLAFLVGVGGGSAVWFSAWLLDPGEGAGGSATIEALITFLVVAPLGLFLTGTGCGAIGASTLTLGAAVFLLGYAGIAASALAYLVASSRGAAVSWSSAPTIIVAAFTPYVIGFAISFWLGRKNRGG
jgi:hypothetical protein